MTDDCTAKPIGGARHEVLLHERNWLLARNVAAPDLTIRALRAEVAERVTRVGKDAVWHFLSRERLTFKESLHAAEQLRLDVAAKRERWKRYQSRVDPARLVFIDG